MLSHCVHKAQSSPQSHLQLPYRPRRRMSCHCMQYTVFIEIRQFYSYIVVCRTDSKSVCKWGPQMRSTTVTNTVITVVRPVKRRKSHFLWSCECKCDICRNQRLKQPNNFCTQLHVPFSCEVTRNLFYAEKVTGISCCSAQEVGPLALRLDWLAALRHSMNTGVSASDWCRIYTAKN